MVNTVLIFVKRKPGMSFADFRDYAQNKHVPFAAKLMGSAWPESHTTYYTQPDGQHSPPPDYAGGSDYDGFSVLKFPSQEAMNAGLAKAAEPEIAEQIAADEEKVFDRSKTKVVFVDTAVF